MLDIITYLFIFFIFVFAFAFMGFLVFGSARPSRPPPLPQPLT